MLINAQGRVKVADFGVSALGQVAEMTVGSPYWMAPEVIEAPQSAQSYGVPCDIWALGIVAIELLEGRSVPGWALFLGWCPFDTGSPDPHGTACPPWLYFV